MAEINPVSKCTDHTCDLRTQNWYKHEARMRKSAPTKRALYMINKISKLLIIITCFGKIVWNENSLTLFVNGKLQD